MTTAEITEVKRALPFAIDDDLVDTEGGAGFMVLRWLTASSDDIPVYWSQARDRWLRQFVYRNGPVKTAVNTFINKTVTIPWSVQARDRSISRHVRSAETLEVTLRRVTGSMSSGPLRGFKSFLKMFVKDYLTCDNGSFAVVLGAGRADGPIVGAPTGLMHLDSSLCIRTRDDEYPVKYLNSGRGGDHKEYKLHYTRVIEMCNLPSSEIDLNGVGLCPVSCCVEAAQELYDIYRYNQEMFGSHPPKKILYAKKGATLKTIQDAIEAWQLKLASANRTHFGGTLVMAPRGIGQEMELDTLDLHNMPEDFNRRDVTTIDKSEIAAAFGLDLRDLAYVMGAPSRTGDAEVQDKKGRGKGVGEFIETFVERMEEVYFNKEIFALEFDNMDDDQDEQEAIIRDKRSAGRERDLRSGITIIRVERERMWENGEITYEQFAEMELEDGRLPEGLDVLLLFQSEDKDFKTWLDVGVADPTNIEKNDPQKMADTIHDKHIEVSRLIHEETNAQRRRKARQALAALDKLRSMYQVPEGQAITDEATVAAMDAGAAAGVDPTTGGTSAPTPKAQQKPQAAGSKPKATTKEVVAALLRASGDGMETTVKQIDFMDDPDFILYQQQFRYLVEQAIRAEIPQARFEETMSQIVASILLTIFMRGSRLSISEMSEEMRIALDVEVSQHLTSLRGFSEDIYVDQLYVEGGQGLQGALNRIATWMTIASGVYYMGQLFRADDPYLEWRYSILKEHCSDCARLNGQVHRATEWRAAGWRPRSWALECHGLHCGCTLIEVSGPSSGAF